MTDPEYQKKQLNALREAVTYLLGLAIAARKDALHEQARQDEDLRALLKMGRDLGSWFHTEPHPLQNTAMGPGPAAKP